MKLLIILALAAVVLARPEEGHYDSKYDNFNVDEIIANPRLMKAYTHCFIGDGKCTAEGKEIKSWMPEATQTSCGKCTDKQKVLVAKSIKAVKEQLPKEYEILIKQNDPEGKYSESIKKYLEKYAP